jgi:hypothetical protein
MTGQHVSAELLDAALAHGDVREGAAEVVEAEVLARHCAHRLHCAPRVHDAAAFDQLGKT